MFSKFCNSSRKDQSLISTPTKCPLWISSELGISKSMILGNRLREANCAKEWSVEAYQQEQKTMFLGKLGPFGTRSLTTCWFMRRDGGVACHLYLIETSMTLFGAQGYHYALGRNVARGMWRGVMSTVLYIWLCGTSNIPNQHSLIMKLYCYSFLLLVACVL